jgi:hypothetical protein
MRKLPTVEIDNRPRFRKRRLFLIFVVVPLAILSPVIYEGSLLCIAGWQGLFGTHPRVETPILDSLTEGYRVANYDVKRWSRGFFNNTPWKSSYVIPFAIFWTGVLAMLLRKA